MSKKIEMQKKCFFSCHFFFILTILIVVCFKVMKLGEAMALGTPFVNSKHNQNVAVSMDILITHSFPLTFTGVERYLLFNIFVCSMIRSNSNTSNSDAGKKDQNSL